MVKKKKQPKNKSKKPSKKQEVSSVKKKKIYDKKPNGKNNTGRPPKWESVEQLEQLIQNYFLSISLTKPKFYEKSIPIGEKTEYKVINTFFKYERGELADEEEDEIIEDKKEKRKRIWYKTVLVPVVNNLGEQVMETIRYEEPMITGLAKYLGTTRETLCDYQGDPKFSDTIKRAKLLVEQKYEERLVGGGGSGSIFALKNMGWSDNRNVSFKDETPKETDKEETEKSEEELMKELAEIQKKKNLASKQESGGTT